MVIVLWSGGMDSTFLVKKYMDEGHKVDAVYFTLENNDTKTKMELQATKKLSKFFNEMSNEGKGEFLFSNQAMGRAEVSRGGDIVAHQVPFWILAALFSIDSSVDEVAIGYVQNDCMISFLDDIRRVYKAYQPFFSYKLPKLVFPLMKWTKQEIKDALAKELMDLCVWCECPTELVGDRYEPCGHCSPCKRHRELEPWKFKDYKAPECEKMTIEDGAVELVKPSDKEIELLKSRGIFNTWTKDEVFSKLDLSVGRKSTTAWN